MNRSKTLGKIVVALDGSVAAWNAANIAMQIAQSSHLEIKGLYIVDEPMILDPYADHSKELGSDPGMASRARLIEQYKEVGYKILDQLRAQSEAKGIPTKTEILLGDVPDLILKSAEQASFLALGRRGNGHASSAERLGEIYHHIARHARVPLIVGGEVTTQIKRVYLFYDGNENSGRALDLAIDIQRTASIDVIVGLLAPPEPEMNLNAFRVWFHEKGLSVERIQDLHAVHIYTILDMLRDENIDICIMGGYRHQKILGWLVGSSVDQFLSQIALPVLIA